LSLGHAGAVLVVVLILCSIQIPHRTQQLIQAAPAFAPKEIELFPSTELLAARAQYFKSEFHDRQRRALHRLDRLEQLLDQLKASPESLRAGFGRVGFPGISEKQLTCDALSLLTPRPQNSAARADLAARTPELIELLRPEPESIPPWLDAGPRAVPPHP
jgi:hypothetical protein